MLHAFSNLQEGDDDEPASAHHPPQPAQGRADGHSAPASPLAEPPTRIGVSAARAAKPRWPSDYTFGIFVDGGRARSCCHRAVEHPAFGTLVLAHALASSVALALHTPRLELTPHVPLAVTLRAFDVFAWPWLLLAELLLRSVAHGVVLGERAVLRSGWRCLDVLVLVGCLLVLASYWPPLLGALAPLRRRLRLLRALRLLLLVEHHEGMLLIVHWLRKALPKVSRVLLVMLALQIVFAALGMQLFMGRLSSCEGQVRLPPKAARRLPMATPRDCLPLGHPCSCLPLIVHRSARLLRAAASHDQPRVVRRRRRHVGALAYQQLRRLWQVGEAPPDRHRIAI